MNSPKKGRSETELLNIASSPPKMISPTKMSNSNVCALLAASAYLDGDLDTMRSLDVDPPEVCFVFFNKNCT